jgi:hypothetical protein
MDCMEVYENLPCLNLIPMRPGLLCIVAYLSQIRLRSGVNPRNTDFVVERNSHGQQKRLFIRHIIASSLACRFTTGVAGC